MIRGWCSFSNKDKIKNKKEYTIDYK